MSGTRTRDSDLTASMYLLLPHYTPVKKKKKKVELKILAVITRVSVTRVREGEKKREKKRRKSEAAAVARTAALYMSDSVRRVGKERIFIE